MIVIEVRDIVQEGNMWVVPYTRKTPEGKPYKGMFLCETLEEAQQKYAELIAVIKHNDGVYIGKKANRKPRSASKRATPS